MRIRTLTTADALPYRDLMLEAYASAPDAFTSTAEERAIEPESWWARRIADPNGLGAALGAEDGGSLVGTVALEYSAKPKTKHTALLIGMYVRPGARGTGVGSALVAAALRHACERPGILVVALTVTEGNAQALGLYQRAGFKAWGTQPLAIATPAGYRGKVHMSCRLPGHAPGAAA